MAKIEEKSYTTCLQPLLQPISPQHYGYPIPGFRLPIPPLLGKYIYIKSNTQCNWVIYANLFYRKDCFCGVKLEKITFFGSSFFLGQKKKKSWNPAYSCCKDFLGYWVTFFRSLIEKNQKCSEKSLNRECL